MTLRLKFHCWSGLIRLFHSQAIFIRDYISTSNLHIYTPSVRTHIETSEKANAHIQAHTHTHIRILYVVHSTHILLHGATTEVYTYETDDRPTGQGLPHAMMARWIYTLFWCFTFVRIGAPLVDNMYSSLWWCFDAAALGFAHTNKMPFEFECMCSFLIIFYLLIFDAVGT